MITDMAGYRLLIEHRLASANDVLAGFPNRLALNAERAMAQSLGVFEAAGEQAVCKRVLAAMDRGAPMEEIAESAIKVALTGALHGSRSTSPASDLMAECMTASWARVAAELRGVS